MALDKKFISKKIFALRTNYITKFCSGNGGCYVPF